MTAEAKKDHKRVYPEDNAAYLEAAGWIPTGHPKDPTTRWLDPLGSDVDKEELVVIKEKGLKNPNGSVEDLKQWKITPRRQPMHVAQAVQKQMIRDGRIKVPGAAMKEEQARAAEEFRRAEQAKKRA